MEPRFVCALECGVSYLEQWKLHLHEQSEHEKPRWLPFQQVSVVNSDGESEYFVPSYRERHGKGLADGAKAA